VRRSVSALAAVTRSGSRGETLVEPLGFGDGAARHWEQGTSLETKQRLRSGPVPRGIALASVSSQLFEVDVDPDPSHEAEGVGRAHDAGPQFVVERHR
jgi:hypothetical protein